MAVFLYASIFLAEGKYADYCCSTGDLPYHGTGQGNIYGCCCTASTVSCAAKTHVIRPNQDITLYDVAGSCSRGFCGNSKSNRCRGDAEQPTCSNLNGLTVNGGSVVVYKTYTTTDVKLRSLNRKYASPQPITLKTGNTVSVVRSIGAGTEYNTLAQVKFNADTFSSIFNINGKNGGLYSGGNATATAEEVDEVMDKFLADGEMELSNPVLITSIGAVFVILLAAIYCFCCKKKRGANDSRSESHGRQHSNTRNTTRYTKPRKESRKAHE